jgi:hypothetical protein
MSNGGDAVWFRLQHDPFAETARNEVATSDGFKLRLALFRAASTRE